MNPIDLLYQPEGGLYGRVLPITDVPPPVVQETPGIVWDPLSPAEYHATVCYDREARVPLGEIAAFLERRGVTTETTWRAHPASTLQHWANDGKLYLGLELYSPELFAFQEDVLASLKIKRSFPTYKCHITLGKWRGLDALGLLDNRVFCNDFVTATAKGVIPASIELSMLRFENALSSY